MESWRLVFRNGFAPHLSREQLQSLRDALAADDPRLKQGSTTTPPPLMCVQDWPCECACVVAWFGFLGDSSRTVGQVEEEFARLCYLSDQTLGEPAACRWLINWWDDTPRAEAVAAMLEEVETILRSLPCVEGNSPD